MTIITQLLMLLSISVIVESICPNNCSGHGVCKESVCECFSNVGFGNSESYGGADCSERICFVGNPFAAVHSMSPSESGISSYVNVRRELSMISSRIREASEDEAKPYGITLIENFDGDKKLWRVSGLKDLMEYLPMTGAILSCKYYNKDGNELTGLTDPTTANVIGYGDDYQYVLFDKLVNRIGDSPKAETGDITYSKVECDKVISVRYDLSQTIPLTYTVPTPPSSERRSLSSNNTRQLDDVITWAGYGPILQEMGLFTPKENNYVNDDFRFACYIKDGVSSTTEVKVVNKVKVEYNPKADTDPDDVKFSFDAISEKLDAGTYTCLCLMNEQGKIEIESSEIFYNIRNEDGYKIGKYKASNNDNAGNNAFITVEGDYPVAVTKNDIASGDNYAVTFTDAIEEKNKLYFDKNRRLYVTALNGGIFSEYEVEIKEVNFDTKTVTIKNIQAGIGVVLPYLRTFSISELTSKTATPTIELSPLSGQSGPKYVYKAHYFYDNLLSSFSNDGGILLCKYNSDENDIKISVKGIARNDKTIFFSYIESEKNDLASATLDCHDVYYANKDLTLLNPSSFTFTTTRQRQLGVNPMEWKKYGLMLNDFGIKSTANFACFNMMSKGKQIIKYETSIAFDQANADKITFTITSASPTEVGTYLCFLLNKFSTPEKPLTLKDLPNSEIKDRIKVDKDNNVYYGEFIIDTKTRSDRSELYESDVIVLGSGSTITLGESSKTIKISDYSDVKSLIDSKLGVNAEFYLKLINTASPFDEKFVKFTVDTPDANEGEGIIKISTTDNDISGYSPYYVIYLSEPKKIEPNDPPKPPTVISLDESNYLYQINNYLDEEVLKEFGIIGGKLQCKRNGGSAEIVDVQGTIKEGDDVIGFYQFEDKESKDSIESCRYLSSRKDLSLYFVLKYVKNSNIKLKGYGKIFSEIRYKYAGEKKIMCYDPSKEINNRKMSIYGITMIKVNDDLELRFNNNKPSEENNICYLLSDMNGEYILGENSELWSSIRKESDGSYYFGKVKIDAESGKSEEIKKSDGSISTIFSSKAVVTTADSSDDGSKMYLGDLNKNESPSFKIPPSYIGVESEKMLYAGTTVKFTFMIDGEDKGSQSSQIMKVEKEETSGIERYKISLSSQIQIPDIFKKAIPRLRSLADSPDASVYLDFSTEGSTHVSMECSGQGICDRSSGLCKCYVGYSGSGCQRLDCPNNCNGNGRCVALSELLSNPELENYEGFGNKHIGKYKDDPNGQEKEVQFENQVYGCLCDKRHRGYDCSLIECPSGEDPEKATNMPNEDDEKRDCSGRGICDYKTGICECFDGFSGEGCQIQAQTM